MIHITHLLKILYLRDKTPIDLFDIHPPEEFLYHVLYKPENQLDLHCIAPWCSSYKKKSTLKRTGTKRKIKKNGEMHCDYQTCMECGCEYYWNEKDEQIDKRQYIQCYPFILSNATLIELMEKTQLSETKCRHIMAYFKTRLDQFGVYNLNVQNLRRLKTAVYRDLRMSEIRSWNCWDNEDHFLEYWYHQDIISEKLFFQKKVSERIPREKILTQIKEICKTYIEANMDISLKNVAKEVGVSTNTISDWQVAQDYIKEMKRHQREGRLNIRKEQLYNQVNEFIDNFTGRKLHSKDIYEHIQVKQSFLTTAAPDLVKYITGRRKEYNRQMYDVKNF
ncbi:hypothetical protein ACPV3A_32685 [Paenibacillus sp. Dod16]|uniref:hypothetical protein n=1 Tax=Paenibacillus sp. Dod16 TaxID=3416392 RepID=UPI003CF9FEA5